MYSIVNSYGIGDQGFKGSLVVIHRTTPAFGHPSLNGRRGIAQLSALSVSDRASNASSSSATEALGSRNYQHSPTHQLTNSPIH